MDPIALVFRWLHIVPVVILAGGAVFMRLVLLPATDATQMGDRGEMLNDAIRMRWKKCVHVGIALIMISGLFNVYNAIFNLHKPPLYHGLFLVKFIMAMAVFLISSALVGRSAGFSRLRENTVLWLTITVVLIIVILLISGIMKSVPNGAVVA